MKKSSKVGAYRSSGTGRGLALEYVLDGCGGGD